MDSVADFLTMSRVITNQYQDFHLLALGQLMSQGDQRGPFMWVQDGCAPDDPRQRSCSFVLTRRGTWLHYYLFLALPDPVRRHCALFETTAEAFDRAAALPGKPVIEDALSLPELIQLAGFTPSDSDATGRALLDELKRRHPDAPVKVPPSNL